MSRNIEKESTFSVRFISGAAAKGTGFEPLLNSAPYWKNIPFLEYLFQTDTANPWNAT